MTIDERLEKLTERHEALAQSVELMTIEGRAQSVRIAEQGKNIDKLLVTVTEQGKNIEKQGANVQLNNFRIDKLLIIVEGLANHAEDHAKRLNKLES